MNARYLQADAFGGYDGIYASGRVVEVACWAHARRKFYDADASDPGRSHLALATGAGAIRHPPPHAESGSWSRRAYRRTTSNEFQCVRCQTMKKFKLVAVHGGDWSKLLCNGCYGLLMSKKD